ncbi:flagellin N-terminal helical domain-containing protein [Methylobacterium brachiatum]
MSSLLTNTAAMTALTTLKTTNQSLETTSNRVATGQKVATAADNAAYWSIATTIRADTGSLNAVKDSIGLGLSSVNAAINGLENAKNTFQSLKDRLTAAKNPTVDRLKIQTEISAKQTDLKTYAESATVNGEAWLSTDSSAGTYTAERKIVASFSRVQGQISVGTVTVNVDETKLYDAGGATGGVTGTGATGGADLETYNSAKADWAQAEKDWIRADKGSTAAVAAYASAQADWASAQSTWTAKKKDLNDGVTEGTDSSGGIFNKKYAVFGEDKDGLKKGYLVSVDTIDVSGISNNDLSKLNAYINAADKVLGDITTVATKLGAIQSQIQSQSNYVDSLIKVNDKSVGILVDADMEEESTKLKALQVQQQLGVQALTIANTTTQQILSLFRS